MRSIKIIPNHKYFDSQEADEKIVFIVRHHWTILVVPFIVGAVILGLTGLITLIIGSFENISLSATGETIFICVISLIFLFTILYIFISWLIRYLNIIILTGEHLVEIHQLAIFSRKVSELDLDCIEDASSSQKGLIQTLFHFGNVLVQTAGELPSFNLCGIEDPNGIQQKIMETKETYMKDNVYNRNNNNLPIQNQIPDDQTSDDSTSKAPEPNN
jgi:uncharacterized membrane protein YdbT with pleckstrin-like domain